MSENIIEGLPETSMEIRKILYALENNIKSQIDLIQDRVTVEAVKNIIVGAIAKIELFKGNTPVEYKFDNTTKIVSYNAVLERMQNILNGTIEDNILNFNASRNLDVVIEKIIEYKDLNLNEIPANSFEQWNRLVQPKLDNTMLEYLKNLIYDPTVDHIQFDIDEANRISKDQTKVILFLAFMSILTLVSVFALRNIAVSLSKKEKAKLSNSNDSSSKFIDSEKDINPGLSMAEGILDNLINGLDNDCDKLEYTRFSNNADDNV